jgi:hypothetical protein
MIVFVVIIFDGERICAGWLGDAYGLVTARRT